MPIDGSIALSGKPVNFDTGELVNLIAQGQQRRMQQESHQQQMQIGQQQLQSGALDLKERQQKISEGDQLKELFKPVPGPDGQPATPDIRASLPKVYAINPNLGMAMQKSLHDQEKGELDTQEAQLKVSAEKTKQLSSIAGTITDEGSFHRGITDAVAKKVIPPATAAALLQQGWNPQTAEQVKQLATAGATVDQQHAQGIADLKEKRDALDAQHKREMEPFQTAEAKGKAEQVTRENDATAVAAASKQGPEALLSALNQLPPERRGLFAGVTPQTKPEDILSLGMKPHEQAAAITAAKNAENNVSEYELELRAAKGDANAKTALANRQRDKIAAVKAGRDPSIHLDREINQYGKPFDEMVKGTDSQLDKILDAEKMVAGGAVSQALAIPKVLSALVSGQGSGVRINQAEINAIAKARGLTGSVEGFFSKLTGNGALTAEQKKQLNGILEDVRTRIVEKKMIARQVGDDMFAATDRQGVLDAASKGKAALDAHAASGGTALPKGDGKPIDEATGKKFYDAAGGDPAKARKMAMDAGWKVQ